MARNIKNYKGTVSNDQLIEAREVGDEEMLFERRNNQNFRPFSAKVETKKTAGGYRPTSANRIGTKRRRFGRNANFFNHPPPKQLPGANYDKEQLYEQARNLKSEANNLRDENLRLKTRLKHTEELVKREKPSDARGGSHLVSNLKVMIKDLQKENGSLEEENQTLRKNIKSTRISELEVEIQSYIDECTRLRYHLEEVLKQQQGFNPDNEDYEEERNQLGQEINNLRRENNSLNQALSNATNQNDQLRETIIALEKRSKKPSKAEKSYKDQANKFRTAQNRVKEELKHTKQELNKQKKLAEDYKAKSNDFASQCRDHEQYIKHLRGQMAEQNKAQEELQTQLTTVQKAPAIEAPAEPRVDPGVRRLLKRINKYCKERNYEATVFFSLVDREQTGLLTITEMTTRLKAMKLCKKSTYVEKLIRMFGKDNVQISSMVGLYSKFNFDGEESDPESSDDEDEQVPPSPKKAQPEKPAAATAQPKEQPEVKPSPPKEEPAAAPQAKPEPLSPAKPSATAQPKQSPKVKNPSSPKKPDEPKEKSPEAPPQQFAGIPNKSPAKAAEPQKQEKPKEPSPKKALTPTAELDFSPGKDSYSEEEFSDSYESSSPEKQESPVKAKPITATKVKEITPDVKPKKQAAASKPSAEVQEVLSHISLRMQLYRLPKTKLATTLFGKNYDPKSKATSNLDSQLQKQPFNVEDDSERAFLVKFITQDAKEAKAGDVVTRFLEHLDEWEVFSPDKEQVYDKQIATVISQNLQNFKDACKVNDINREGIISLTDFMDVLGTLGVKFDPEPMQYMKLLFYSHSFELNKVPYAQFIDAYGAPAEGSEAGEESYEDEGDEFADIDDLGEEERAAIVRECLKVIAKALKQSGKTCKKAFKAKGVMLYSDEFIKGLEGLNIQNFDKNVLVIFMESLQSEEEEDELCIDFPYLENLIEHYLAESSGDEGEEDYDEEASYEDSADYDY